MERSIISIKFAGGIMDRKYVFDKKKKVSALSSKIVAHIGGSVDYRDYYAECCKHISDSALVEYLRKYGLPTEFLLQYHVGYDESRKLITVPHTQDFFTNVYIGDPNKSFLTFQQKTEYE